MSAPPDPILRCRPVRARTERSSYCFARKPLGDDDGLLARARCTSPQSRWPGTLVLLDEFPVDE